MKRWLVRYESERSGPDDHSDAMAEFQREADDIEVMVMDVQELRIPEITREPDDHETHLALARESAHAQYEEEESALGSVVHPWDQGLNIFPDDHPLAPYERLARDHEDYPFNKERQEKEKAIFLEIGRRLELTP